MDQPQPMITNIGKKLKISIENKKFMRIPIKTHLIKENDDIIEVATQYLRIKYTKEI